MAKKIKSIKEKLSTDSFSAAIPFGCDAANVDMADGKTLEEKVVEINNSIDMKITGALGGNY